MFCSVSLVPGPCFKSPQPPETFVPVPLSPEPQPFGFDEPDVAPSNEGFSPAASSSSSATLVMPGRLTPPPRDDVSFVSDPGRSWVDENFEDITPPSSPEVLYLCPKCGTLNYLAQPPSCLYVPVLLILSHLVCFTDAEFSDWELYDNHCLTIHQYQCKCCNLWFEQIDEILLHMASGHHMFYNLAANIYFPPFAATQLEHVLNPSA